MEILPQILNAIAWPVVILVIALTFRGTINSIFSRVNKVVANTTGFELILKQLVNEGQISSDLRTQLSGLTSHDLWALYDFSNGKIPNVVSKMSVVQQAAARFLIDAKFLEIESIENDRKIKTTLLGEKVLEKAKSLL